MSINTADRMFGVKKLKKTGSLKKLFGGKKADKKYKMLLKGKPKVRVWKGLPNKDLRFLFGR